jgi:putative transposase
MTIKSKYIPDKHHRRSIRLKGYDYARPGAYFVTICTQNRECFFGEIVDGQMKLNDAGRMVVKWYYELERKFPDIKCDKFVCMPNHVHFILIHVGTVGNVGTDLRVCPDETGEHTGSRGEQIGEKGEHADQTGGHIHPMDTHVGTMGGHADPTGGHGHTTGGQGGHADTKGEHGGSPLPRIIQWFKTMTTNEYIHHVKNDDWRSFDKKLWQRNYYEHIIRDETGLTRIREYIRHNPERWQDDKNHRES